VAVFSKTQINKLGDRLRHADPTADDLRLLDSYRLSFADVATTVVAKLREQLGLVANERAAKSTPSIVAKLRREKTRLTTMQDIAGCRVVVETLHDQDRTVAQILTLFPDATIIDRRDRPSHGYRAVHVITSSEKPVEIQIRTALQHKWAEMSEKLADVVDPRLKYGEGPRKWLRGLQETSDYIAEIEAAERTGDYQVLEESATELGIDPKKGADLARWAVTMMLDAVKSAEFRKRKSKKR
jgi:GTP pyrophosphokinase